MFGDNRRLTGREAADRFPDSVGFQERLHDWRALSLETQNRLIAAGDGPFQPSTEPERGRLRVGLWCPCLGLGGAEVWQLALARAVDSNRIVWKGAAVLDPSSSCDPTMVRQLGAMMPVGRGLRAARDLAAVSDVIISWAVTNVAALLDGLADPPRVVMACHFPGESPWGPGTEELLAGVDRFVAVSELAIESTPASVRNRLAVIWNAVDPDRMVEKRGRDLTRAVWNVPVEAPVVGYVGRLAPEKDPEALLRLARELPDPWHVVVVGEGRERPALSREIAATGLSRVRLVGGDAAVGDVLAGFDVLVVPSWYESFGLTLAEGLWAGIPVIATRSGVARLVPGLIREIPVMASGRAILEALQADQADWVATKLRVEQAQAFVCEHLTLERFGGEWTGLLINLGRQEREGGIDAQLLDGCRS